jgi:hypothetical protein
LKKHLPKNIKVDEVKCVDEIEGEEVGKVVAFKLASKKELSCKAKIQAKLFQSSRIHLIYLSSMPLCITNNKSIIIIIFPYVFIWFSIIHRYLCQCQV